MASDPRKVRTTFEPNRVIEVGEKEFKDLTRQGLIHEVVGEKAKSSEKGA